MSNTIKESLVKDQPIPVSIEGTRKILYQMENCICQIHKKDGTIGTGFFCEIPFNNNNNLMKVFITNNHVLNEKEIENNQIIDISIINKDNQEKLKKIIIDNTRIKYTNPKLDVTIIEIKPNKDEINNFMEIDMEDIKKDKDILEVNYRKKSAYILHYPKGRLSVSYGLINDIIDGKINHYCNTEVGSSGSPILSLENNKIIGIHYGGSGNKLNFGKFIKNVINEFNKGIKFIPTNNLSENNNIDNNLDKANNIINSNDLKSYINPEDYYFSPNKTDIHDIKLYFPIPPLIGLENIDNNSLMNSTLQCFCSIEKLINFFKYTRQARKIFEMDKSKLSSLFKLLIEKLWPNNYNEPNLKKSYAPYEFIKKISLMNPSFKGDKSYDIKDLVKFIILTLHSELNKANINNIINSNLSLDQTNPQLMFNNFANNFMNQNKSIISDLFYGINCGINQCGNCGIKTYNYQKYFFLEFPLEEVLKFKLSNINNFNFNFNNNNYNNNVVNIYDCFDYDKKINILSGNNSNYCNFCKCTSSSSKCTVLTTGAEILILLLNRGKAKEYDVNINYAEYLNLLNYITYANTGCNYKLIGIIFQIGKNGLFIAYCLDPISHEWLKYNDSIVSKVINFKNEVINNSKPYSLFYQKINGY